MKPHEARTICLFKDKYDTHNSPQHEFKKGKKKKKVRIIEKRGRKETDNLTKQVERIILLSYPFYFPH